MNFVVPQEVRWIFLGDIAEATAQVDIAARSRGFRSLSSPPAFLVEVPRSLRKRRPTASITGVARPSELGTEIIWDCGPDMNRAYEHLLALEAEFPDEKIHYNGMVEVSATEGLAFEGRRIFRAVASRLQVDEWVLAVAQGKAGDEPCVVVLTDRRLLVLGECLEGPALVNAPLGTIETMTLGKKSSGETLLIGCSPSTALITNLGHGEGHAVATTFRLRVSELARTRPLFPSNPHRE